MIRGGPHTDLQRVRLWRRPAQPVHQTKMRRQYQCVLDSGPCRFLITVNHRPQC
jgi:hypothetical protein